MAEYVGICSHVQALDALSEHAEIRQKHDVAVLLEETLLKVFRVGSRKHVTKTADLAHDCMVKLGLSTLNLLEIFTETLDAREKHLHRTLHSEDVHRH